MFDQKVVGKFPAPQDHRLAGLRPRRKLDLRLGSGRRPHLGHSRGFGLGAGVVAYPARYYTVIAVSATATLDIEYYEGE